MKPISLYCKKILEGEGDLASGFLIPTLVFRKSLGRRRFGGQFSYILKRYSLRDVERRQVLCSFKRIESNTTQNPKRFRRKDRSSSQCDASLASNGGLDCIDKLFGRFLHLKFPQYEDILGATTETQLALTNNVTTRPSNTIQRGAHLRSHDMDRRGTDALDF